MRRRGGSEQPVKGRRANRPKARTIAAPSIADLQKQVGILTRELKEAREQQTATADVLRVISGATFELQRVLDTLTESAARLCEAHMAGITRREDSAFYYATSYGFPAGYLEFARTIPLTAGRGSIVGRALVEGRTVHVADVLADPEFERFDAQKRAGFRTFLAVPMLREGSPIGVIALGRSEVRPFTDRQIELVTTFADQAVIAIENARLLTETRESLQQQTATAEVLQVINSWPGDLAPVFDAMLEKATRLCGAGFGTLWIYEGEQFRAAAGHGVPPALAEFVREPAPVEASASLVEIVRGRNVVHVPDLAASELYHAGNRVRHAHVDLGGARTLLSVALRKDSTLLGAFNVYRQEVSPFSDKQIALVQNFAAQAVIAMENARLITETREALEQQIATVVKQHGGTIDLATEPGAFTEFVITLPRTMPA